MTDTLSPLLTHQKRIQITHTQSPTRPPHRPRRTPRRNIPFLPIDPTRTHNPGFRLRPSRQPKARSETTPQDLHIDLAAADTAQNVRDGTVVVAPDGAVRVFAWEEDAGCEFCEGRGVFGEEGRDEVCKGGGGFG